jgi:hypothetical protein
VNQTAERRGLKMAREAMLAQVAFPRGYLTETARSGEKRFRLSYRATDSRLEAGIKAADSPTPLARFAGVSRGAFVRTGRRGRRPIQVTINPGQPNTIERGFFIQLRSGNIGLGIRLKNGQRLTNTIGAKYITNGPLAGVALLYGPSVDQVFATVATDISPALLEYLSLEFVRQFERLFRYANFQAT